MKANELKIGNYVYNDAVVVSIDARSIFDIWDDKGLKNYNPIPLTEEWLLKFGFHKTSKDKKDRYRLDERLIVIRDNFFTDYGSSVQIKYVHQLQNLYFALTGKELI